MEPQVQRLVMTFTAIKGQENWLVSSAFLERAGLSLLTSLQEDGTWLFDEEGLGYPMGRGARGEIYLDVSVQERGFFDVPANDKDQKLRLQLDSGAHVNVAGRHWESMLSLSDAPGTGVYGVGKNFVEALGAGKAQIRFRSPAGIVWRQARRIVWPKEAVAVKVVSEGGRKRSPAVLLIDGVGQPPAHEGEKKEPAGATTPRLRNGRHRQISTAEEAVQRLHLTSVPALKLLHLCTIGAARLSGIPGNRQSMMSDAFLAAAFRRSSGHHFRTAASFAEDEMLVTGQRWHMDLVGHMHPDLDGNTTGLFVVEHKSRFVAIWLMLNKTFPQFGAAMDKFLAFARSHHPNAGTIQLGVDSDPVWTVSARGDEVETHEFGIWQRERGYPFILRRSSAYQHSQAAAEGAYKRVTHVATANLHQGHVNPILWGDAMRAACSQVNACPLMNRGAHVQRRTPGTGGGGGGGPRKGATGGGAALELPPRTPYELFMNRKPDVSRFLGTCFQPCFMLNPAGRNLGDPKATPALYIMPSASSAGSVVRCLGPGLKSMQTGHLTLAFPVGNDLLHTRVAQSAQLLRASAALAGSKGALLHESMSRLFDHSDPAVDYTTWLVRFERFLGLPVQLVQAFDPVTGEAAIEMRMEGPTHLEQRQGGGGGAAAEEAPAGGQDHAVAGSPPSISASGGAGVGVGEARGGRKWIDALPDATPIQFNLSHNKKGASQIRWMAYSSAVNMGEARAAQKHSRQLLDDLVWDYKRGHVRFPEGAGALDGLEPITHTLPSTVYLSLSEAINDAEEEARTLTLDDLFRHAASHVHEHGRARDAAIATQDATMRAVLRIEALEGVVGPPLGGADGHLLKVMEHAGAEDRETQFVGTGLAGLEEIFIAEEAVPDGRGGGRSGAADNAAGAEGDRFTTVGDRLIGREPIRGVNAASRHPEWNAPSSLLRAAVERELTRVLVTIFPGRTKPCILVVPKSNYFRDLARWGPTVVELKNIVMPIRAKHEAGGSFVRVAARVTYGDISKVGEKAKQTFSANVVPSSVKLTTQLNVELPGSSIVINDVEGAYYNGTPAKAGTLGGRLPYAIMPARWDWFGVPRWDPVTGEENVLLIDGNLPGLAAAGSTWGKVYTHWMTVVCGFTQSVVDRQLFYLKAEGGRLLLVCGIHVDDGITLDNDHPAFRRFEGQWIERFGGERSPLTGREVTSWPYLGLLYRRVSEILIEVTAPRLYDQLVKLLRAAERTPGAPTVGTRSASPIVGDATDKLKVKGPEVNPEVKGAAWSLFGMIGYLATQLRPDVMFGFVVISQQVGSNFTVYVFTTIIHLARYLVATRNLPLCYRRTRQQGNPPGSGGSGAGSGGGALMVGFHADSSANNSNPGNWGGFCSSARAITDDGAEQPAGSPGPTSAVMMWKALTPYRMADGTVGGEGILATYATKELIAWRVLLRELGLVAEQPTQLRMDALGTLRGVEMERISQASRYLATRVAMLRQAVQDGAMELVYVPTGDNMADIFTKPLVGATFKKMRALVMGLEPRHELLVECSGSEGDRQPAGRGAVQGRPGGGASSSSAGQRRPPKPHSLAEDRPLV